MSNTDETISIRPPLPACCACWPPAGGRARAITDRLAQGLRHDISVNTRMNKSMLDAGIEVRLVCVDC